MIVVDASVALAWCLADEQDDVADAALARVELEGALAPAHWPLEVANGLWSAERRGRLTEEDVLKAMRLLVALDIDIVPVELSTAGGVIETARERGLSVYDACYVDLARVRGVDLATIDGDLAKAGANAGVVVVRAD